MALNPLELPRTPEDPIKDAENLARDLAYGAARGDWEPTFIYFDRDGATLLYKYEEGPVELFNQKWTAPYPEAAWLVIFGYAEKVGEESYQLTPQAFELLKKPAETPDVFISYRHKESSTFALLIEARLRLAGVQTVFVDKYIKGGESWHGTLQDKVRDSEYLVCLIGPTSLDEKSFVRQELKWAEDSPTCKIIHVWHNGLPMLHELPGDLAFLRERHGHEVKEESASEYEHAVNFILNALGYNTY